MRVFAAALAALVLLQSDGPRHPISLSTTFASFMATDA
jgi:hypothetical protein